MSKQIHSFLGCVHGWRGSLCLWSSPKIPGGSDFWGRLVWVFDFGLIWGFRWLKAKTCTHLEHLRTHTHTHTHLLLASRWRLGGQAGWGRRSPAGAHHLRRWTPPWTCLQGRWGRGTGQTDADLAIGQHSRRHTHVPQSSTMECDWISPTRHPPKKTTPTKMHKWKSNPLGDSCHSCAVFGRCVHLRGPL